MKTFEKEIKNRIRALGFYTILIGLPAITVFAIRLTGEMGSDSDAAIFIGGLLGAGMIVLRRLRRYRKALRDKKVLEELHIWETDERNCIIALKTCRACIFLGAGLLGAAGMIASFFNRTVFLTIGAVLLVFLCLYGMLMLFYSRKY